MLVEEKLERFDNIISVLESLRQRIIDDKIDHFNNAINELKRLKGRVYAERLQSAKIAYKKNKSTSQLSELC